MDIQQFRYSADLLRALLWQHNDALNLQGVLARKQLWYDEKQAGFWNDWVRDVFDLRTANEFGCTVWAIILGVPLGLILPPTNKANFGFGTFNKNFNRGNFGSKTSTPVGLTLAQKRILLQLRYFGLTTKPTVPKINRGLKRILGSEGSVYVLDANDMSFVTYVFGFAPNSALSLILQNFDVLPRPAGVGVKYIIATRPNFGFGPFNKNFNRGTFTPIEA